MDALLSRKPFNQYTPEDYKEYVRSLYKPRKVRPARSLIKKAKKPVRPFVFSLNKKRTLLLRVNRKPKWLTREEVDSIAAATGLPLSEVWVKVLKKKTKNPIVISTQEEQDRITAETRAPDAN